ncbi:MAG: hypothetical protein WCW53_15285 [Syntrophales bacterium]
MTDTIIGAFIGVGGAIIGATIAGIVSYCVAVNITRKQELYREYTIFKEAFSNELAFLVSDTKPDSSIHGTTYDVLTKALNKHRHAVNMFMLVLPSEKGEGFNKAWEDYQYPNGYNKDAPFPLIDYEGGDDFEKRKFAHSKISKLLEVAKLK